jgi:hypothetical protein
MYEKLNEVHCSDSVVSSALCQAGRAVLRFALQESLDDVTTLEKVNLTNKLLAEWAGGDDIELTLLRLEEMTDWITDTLADVAHLFSRHYMLGSLSRGPTTHESGGEVRRHELEDRRPFLVRERLRTPYVPAEIMSLHLRRWDRPFGTSLGQQDAEDFGIAALTIHTADPSE